MDMTKTTSLPVSKRDLGLIGDGLALTLKLDGLSNEDRDEIMSLYERVSQLSDEAVVSELRARHNR